MRLFSTEAVSKYHPDKYADQISDAILTECLKQDRQSHCGIETMVKGNTVVLGGEITSKADINYDQIVRRVAKKLGYRADKIIKPVIEALARRYPDITIEHEWANEDLGEGCGRRVYENGEEIEEYYPEGEVESVEYAASVWNYDFCDLGMAKNKTGTRYIHTDYDEYECIEICGKPALFTDERLTEDEIPEGMYLYHLRERDDGDGFASLESKVIVNHGGSVITNEPIALGEDGYIALSDENYPNFMGDTRTLADQMAKLYKPHRDKQNVSSQLDSIGYDLKEIREDANKSDAQTKTEIEWQIRRMLLLGLSCLQLDGSISLSPTVAEPTVGQAISY